jgi:hypothetical protein
MLSDMTVWYPHSLVPFSRPPISDAEIEKIIRAAEARAMGLPEDDNDGADDPEPLAEPETGAEAVRLEDGRVAVWNKELYVSERARIAGIERADRPADGDGGGDGEEKTTGH